MREAGMKKISAVIASNIILSLFISGSYAGDRKGFLIHTKIDIIGAEVRDLREEPIGKITKLERHDDTGDITYAVISLHGEPGSGEILITVPISMLRFKSNDHAHIDMTREKLALFPVYEEGKRPIFEAAN